MSLDFLIIHVPKFSSYYKPYGEYMTVNLIPMGTFALADLAARKGHPTEILHLGLEWIEREEFSPQNFLKEKEVGVVALPLHFHQQSYDVMKIAMEIKKERPNIFLVLGGYTASFFHREILTSFSSIDAIIRGDAEIPLIELLKAIKERRELSCIPNLAWRKGGEIRENPVSYVASEMDLEHLSFSSLSLLKDKETYIRYIGMPFVWAKGFSKRENKKHFHLGPSTLPLNIGRGCLGNCTWCGGGAEAQEVINGRKGVVFRSPEAVVNTVAEAVELGYEMFNIAFDPGREGERYYLQLLPLLKEKGLRVRAYFESFSLPSENFLQLFAGTFIREGSVIALSPESGDEKVRHRNKTFSYSNDELLHTISLAEKLGIKVDLFFALGIPGETYPGLAKTASLRREIKKRFNNIGRIWIAPISLEPASPWHLHPEEFGIVSTKRSFNDFYHGSSPEGAGLGYYHPGYLGEGKEIKASEFERILKEVKCRDYCSLHPDPTKASHPFWGRLFCRYMSWRSRGPHG